MIKQKETICIIGMGFVGLTLALTLAKKGFTVIGIDKNKKIYYCPNFFKDPKDTVGCGDAYFAITSLLVNSAKSIVTISSSPVIGCGNFIW